MLVDFHFYSFWLTWGSAQSVVVWRWWSAPMWQPPIDSVDSMKSDVFFSFVHRNPSARASYQMHNNYFVHLIYKALNSHIPSYLMSCYCCCYFPSRKCLEVHTICCPWNHHLLEVLCSRLLEFNALLHSLAHMSLPSVQFGNSTCFVFFFDHVVSRCSKDTVLRSVSSLGSQPQQKWLNLVLDLIDILCQCLVTSQVLNEINVHMFSSSMPTKIGPKFVYTRPRL